MKAVGLSLLALLFIILVNVKVTRSFNTARVVLSNRDGTDLPMSTVIGREITFQNRKIVREFLGIPYAKPPIQKLRFTLSYAFGSLGEYFNATSMKPACPASVGVGESNLSHEDCLYLNIWAPSDFYNLGAGYPILVAFISGGFDRTHQNDQLFSGLKLAESEDIIVITVSYRVGVFGFLRTDSSAIPGNFGLYDQKLALEWVTANINEFGGDRSRITLLGNGASAATIGYLLLSNAIGNLFKWAIMHGGSPLSSWAFVEPSEAEARAEQLAGFVGCDVTSSKIQLADCLRSVESGKLLTASERLFPNAYYQYIFAPTQDGFMISESPNLLLKRGYNKKTEIMIGVTESEGRLFYEQLFGDIRRVHASVSANDKEMGYNLFKFAVSLLFGSSVPPRGSIAANQRPEDTLPSVIQQLIMFEYKNWEQPDNKSAMLESFKNIIQDKYYSCPILAFAKEFSQSGSGAYVFKLPYLQPKDERNSWTADSSSNNYNTRKRQEIFDSGIQLVFGNSKNDPLLLKTVMQAWGNMAKTGNPNTGQTFTDSRQNPISMFPWQKWSPYTRFRMTFRDPKQIPKVYRFYNVSDVMNSGVWEMSERCAFWEIHIPWQKENQRKKCQQFSTIRLQTLN